MKLPVAQVIAQFLAKDAGAFVVDDDAAGDRAVGFSGRVWSDAFQPGRVLGVVVGRSEIDIFLVAVV